MSRIRELKKAYEASRAAEREAWSLYVGQRAKGATPRSEEAHRAYQAAMGEHIKAGEACRVDREAYLRALRNSDDRALLSFICIVCLAVVILAVY